jgi:rhamnose transport system substrate-binding protein
MSILKKALAAGAIIAGALAVAQPASAEDFRLALVVKNLGNGFFEAANKGANEAAEEIGDMEVIYTAPTAPTAEGQIEILNSLIAQGVDAIAISANDPDALVPTLKKAMDRGITVISWDSGVAPEGRQMHLNPSSSELIARTQLKMAQDAMPEGKNQIAILSATAQATNQNIWIEEMKKALPDFPGLDLVATVYGDDQTDKSYREALGLFQSYPDLGVIIAPTTVGIAASAQAVEDQDLVGKVYVTGLGLPSEMAGHVHTGATKSFAIWNPIDLGYAATQIAYNLAKGMATAEPGAEISMGRMGTVTLDDNNEGAMANPFEYDESNVDEYAEYF